MKLALITPAPIPASTANSIQVMKMAQALVRLGHELRMYAPGTKMSFSQEQLKEHYGLSENLDIAWLASQPALRRYDYALRALRAAEHWGSNLILTRLPQAAALAARRGKPIIFELHDLPSGKLGPRLLSVFLNSKTSRRLVVISEALAEAIRSHYPLTKEDNVLMVAPDGVDLERYEKLPEPSAARTALKLPDAFTVGYTGQFYAGRGIGFLLDLAERLPAMRFLLVGGRREDVSRVKRDVDRRELKNVSLTGFVSNSQLPAYQAACDALLMPYEARVAASSGGNIASFLSPMKMFEYLACGRPILASELNVLGEVLNAQNALILSMDDVGVWAKALKELRADPSRTAKLSKAARATAANYSWQSRAKKIVEGFPH